MAIDRDLVTVGEYPHPLYVVVVRMGQDDRIDGGRIEIFAAQAVFNLAGGEAHIDQQPGVPPFHIDGVSPAAAGQNTIFHMSLYAVLSGSL